MRRLARRLGGALCALGLAWALVVATLHAQRHALIYPFDGAPAAPSIPGVRIAELPAADSAPALPVWLAEPRDGRPWVFFFMGNAGSLARHEARLAAIAGAGYGLAAMAYRGGGGVPGQPSETALKDDAARLWQDFDRLAGQPVPERQRVIWGLSLGSALAVWLAGRADERAVVLESPFTRLCDVARARYPWAPACLLLRDERWDSVAIIARTGSPLLVLHGTADRIVPASQGRALYEAAAEPKRLLQYPGAGHGDLAAHGAVADAFAFLAGLEAATPGAPRAGASTD